MELTTRHIDTGVARSETLSIINGMRYLKLGVCSIYSIFFHCTKNILLLVLLSKSIFNSVESIVFQKKNF